MRLRHLLADSTGHVLSCGWTGGDGARKVASSGDLLAMTVGAPLAATLSGMDWWPLAPTAAEAFLPRLWDSE